MHGRFPAEVHGDDTGFYINGKKIFTSASLDAGAIPWGDFGAGAQALVGVLLVSAVQPCARPGCSSSLPSPTCCSVHLRDAVGLLG